LALAGFSAGLLLAKTLDAGAQTKVRVPALTFPTIINTADDIIKAKGLDKANGIDIEVVSYGAVGAEYAGIAKGEIDAGVLPPYQVSKMRGEGAPIAVYGTMVGMSDTHIITRDPAIKKFTDLMGRSLAATVGFSSYQYLQIYAGKLGLKLGTDIRLVDASTALAQAQLQANRVDAVLVWEPTTTRILTQLPDARIILNGDEAWKSVTGDIGWDIVLFINDGWVKANPGGLERMVKVYKDYGDFVDHNPAEADAIISSEKYYTKGIPPGTIATAVKARRLVIDVHPSWEPAINKQIWQMIELGVKEGYIKTPERAAVYNVAPGK
jgi:ABC-type nitrate/sulfonate/bicarbonate transport system substrate-binding protein